MSYIDILQGKGWVAYLVTINYRHLVSVTFLFSLLLVIADTYMYVQKNH